MDNLQQNSDKPSFESVWALFKETDRKFQESHKEYDERFKDTERLLRERDKEFTRKLNKLEELFTSQWGKLIETLVDGDLINLLNEYDIEVQRTAQREKGYYNDRQYEFDIIAKNGKDIVVVEVKTTLRVKHVKEFISNLKVFSKIMPEYANKNIYGAIAYLQADEKSQVYAESQKLFVIRATGNSASIVNAKNFKPKPW